MGGGNCYHQAIHPLFGPQLHKKIACCPVRVYVLSLFQDFLCFTVLLSCLICSLPYLSFTVIQPLVNITKESLSFSL